MKNAKKLNWSEMFLELKLDIICLFVGHFNNGIKFYNNHN